MRESVRAVVLEEVGKPAVVRELELVEPRAGEARVRMLASGVCHSDLHVRDGEWERPTPIVMGHEGAGVVEAVGPGVTSPRVGELVALSWLVPCGVCRSCRRERTWECPDSPSYRHTLADGTPPRGIGCRSASLGGHRADDRELKQGDHEITGRSGRSGREKRQEDKKQGRQGK